MAKVIRICGRICSGKSTYAKELCLTHCAAVLSVDEIMLALFGQHCGEMHDIYAERTQRFLFEKSLELVESGIDVILDWGFWSKGSRDYARNFYALHAIACEIHYLDVRDALWRSRLEKRNASILAGETLAYYVDENLAAKFKERFERPNREEVDVWVKEDGFC